MRIITEIYLRNQQTLLNNTLQRINYRENLVYFEQNNKIFKCIQLSGMQLEHVLGGIKALSTFIKKEYIYKML